MRVNIHVTDQETGDEKWVGQATLEECFPEQSDRDEALVALTEGGQYITGGGAAPLVRLEAVR